MSRRKRVEALLTEWLRKKAAGWNLYIDALAKKEVGMAEYFHSDVPDLPGGLSYNDLLGVARKAFLYAFPKADNTTDSVVFGLDLEGRRLLVRLIERGNPDEPFHGMWALPGGFLNMDEPLDVCARRELEEETGIQLSYMEQLYTFGTPDRDPRGRVITVAYWGIVRPDQVKEVGGMDDASDSRWFDVTELPALAFDHEDVIRVALHRLRGKLRWQPVGIWLLPEEFTLAELRGVYEIILGRVVDPGSFRRKIKPHQARGVLCPTGTTKKATRGRPPALYTFDESAFITLQRDGLEFEV